MTGEELYNVHREEAARLSAVDSGIAPLVPWDELPWQMKDRWEQRAVEQGERDPEPGRDRTTNYGGMEA